MPAPPQKPAEYEEGLIFQEVEETYEPVIEPESVRINETITPNEVPQVTINQRKVSKVIILFDDGTYQEM